MRPSEDRNWLRHVRHDLDSDPNEWIVKPGQPDSATGISKATCMETYLRRLLDDLDPEGAK